MVSDNYEQERPFIKPYANQLGNKSNGGQKSHMSKQKKWIYYIEERRRQVAV
jgi:hypothetical protein